jgi:mRNA interferase YafQ
MEALFAVIDKLASNSALEEKFRDHPLSGDWQSHRECHIPPDWLLIYRVTEDGLHLERTGSHSELFG